MNRSELLGFTLIVAFPLLVCAGCWLQDRHDVLVTDVHLDGVYRVAGRTVRVVGIRPGEHVVTLVLVDLRTDERAVVTYHEGATFSPSRYRLTGRLG